MDSNAILCFICGQRFDQSEIQNHIFKDKLRYEGQKKVRLTIPEEYNYNASGGLSMSQSIPRKSPRKSPPKKSSPPKRLPGQRPRGLICPLCGREYGTASLQIHMKSCRQKYELQQQELPKHLRKSADKIIVEHIILIL